MDTWDAVDAWFTELLVGEDPELEAALTANRAAGLPAIDVSPPQGKLLHLLARSIGARRVLEVGTLGGYSTIWLGRAVGPEGSVVTLEISAEHAEVARANLARAGLAEVASVVVGPALKSLPGLEGPFDLAFIDADKQNNADYFKQALRLVRPGGLIIVDNVVRDGAIVTGSQDPAVVGTRRLIETVAAEPRVSATAIQTVGTKGYDGFLVALVL